jgi:hypothetical protein
MNWMVFFAKSIARFGKAVSSGIPALAQAGCDGKILFHNNLGNHNSSRLHLGSREARL